MKQNWGIERLICERKALLKKVSVSEEEEKYLKKTIAEIDSEINKGLVDYLKKKVIPQHLYNDLHDVIPVNCRDLFYQQQDKAVCIGKCVFFGWFVLAIFRDAVNDEYELEIVYMEKDIENATKK